MNAALHPPPQATPLAQRLPLYLLIACLPFTDFVQNGLVAFNAAPVMGDIAADLLLDGGTRRDISRFTLGRFAKSG